jgi:O-antigen ligase
MSSFVNAQSSPLPVSISLIERLLYLCGAVAITGVFAIFQTGLATVAIAAAWVIAIISVSRPHIAVASFLISSFLVSDASVVLPGMKLHVADLFFIVMVATALPHVVRKWQLVRRGPVTRAVLALLAVVAFATAVGIVRGNLRSVMAAEVRPFAYFITAVPAAMFLNEEEFRQKVFRTVIIGAMAAILLGIARAIANPAATGGTYELGPIAFARLVWPLTPTFLPVQFGIATLTLLAGRRFEPKWLLRSCIALCLFGMFLSLTRASILAFTITLVAVTYISRDRLWSRRQAVSVVVLLLSGIVAADFASEHALYNRILNATEGEDLNILQRLYETRQVFDRILEHPILGSGIGALHSTDFTLEPPEDPRLWINPTLCHNSYMYFWWKLGIVGVACFVVAVTRSIRHIFSVLRRHTDGTQGVWGLVVFGFILSTLVIAITSPVLFDENVVPLFAALLGITDVLGGAMSAGLTNFAGTRA